MKTLIKSIGFSLLTLVAATASAQTTPDTKTPDTNQSGSKESGMKKNKGCHVTSANQAEVFKKLDTNSDGNISQEEFAMIANLKMGKDRDGKDRDGKDGSGTSGSSKDGTGTSGSTGTGTGTSGSGSEQRPK